MPDARLPVEALGSRVFLELLAIALRGLHHLVVGVPLREPPDLVRVGLGGVELRVPRAVGLELGTPLRDRGLEPLHVGNADLELNDDAHDSLCQMRVSQSSPSVPALAWNSSPRFSDEACIWSCESHSAMMLITLGSFSSR